MRERITTVIGHHMVDGILVADLELCIGLQFDDCIPCLVREFVLIIVNLNPGLQSNACHVDVSFEMGKLFFLSKKG
jgi:hypothetical protein